MRRQELLFLRHGEAENQDAAFRGRVTRDASGRADYPLSARGREQAARAARATTRFAPELVFCSSLRRSKETAAAIAAATGLPAPIEDADLDEVNPGRHSLLRTSFEDRRHAVVSGVLATAFVFDRRVSRRRDGEAAAELSGRIRRVFARLAAQDAERIAIVGHGYWIFTAALLTTPRIIRTLWRTRTIAHVSATRFVRDQGAYRVTAIGARVDGVVDDRRGVIRGAEA